VLTATVLKIMRVSYAEEVENGRMELPFLASQKTTSTNISVRI